MLERADADDVVVVGDVRPKSPHTYYLEGYEGRVISADRGRLIDERDVWILYEPGVDGDRARVRNALGEKYELVRSEEWHLVRVEHYRR